MPKKTKDSWSPPTLEELLRQAEEAFVETNGCLPTCAVYAPGCLNISGDATDFSEGRSVLMPIDLMTVIVGKQRKRSKWCRVKTLSGDVCKQGGSFCTSLKKCNPSDKEILWIRCVKEAVQIFKAKTGGIVPGFKIVIASSVPAKRGLGSSSALVVATYTFLEALTGQPTLNIFEKALSCNLVEKLALQLPSLRLADILCSVFGDQRQILHFHAKILHLEAFPWRDNGVSLLVILPDSSDHDLGYFERAARCRKNTIILNTANRWNTRPIDFHKIDVLFPIELVNGARYISEEDVRVRRTLLAIQSESWTQLGAISTFDPLWRTCSVKDAAETFPCLNLPLPPETFQIGQILWESYYSILKYLDPVSIEIDYIVEALKGTNGVLGVNVIGRGYGGSVLALIKSEEREKISDALKDVKNMWKQCYILRPMKGASVLYIDRKSQTP